MIESVTVDLSIGGALIVRDAGANLGLKFTAIDERYRARLAVMLAHYRRQAQPA